MQHLPSVPLVLRLYFLQVHQTNIPATASAATDPNTAPTTILMVITKLDKLHVISLYSCYGQETFGIQSEFNLFSSHNFLFHNSLHI